MSAIDLARETWHSHDVPVDEQLNHAILQLAAEAGELAGDWAKHLYKPGRALDRDTVIDELGDVWYYVRIIAYLYGISIGDLTQANYEKLRGGHGWDGSSAKVLERLREGMV